MVAVNTGTSAPAASSKQAIGAFAFNNIANGYNWSGSMDDVQLFSGVLSQAQISEVMNQEYGSGLPDGLPPAPSLFVVS